MVGSDGQDAGELRGGRDREWWGQALVVGEYSVLCTMSL